MVEVKREKKNPVLEFSFYYFGTIITLLVLDRFDVLFPGRRAFELIPELSWQNLFGKRIFDNAWLPGLGLLLVFPLHLWRKFVKSLYSPLATRVSGLHPKTLKYDKYLEQAWLATHYTISSLLGGYAILASSDIWPESAILPLLSQESRNSYVPSADLFESHYVHPAVQRIYLLQFTFYFLELATLIFDQRSRSRSDAFVYAIHHVLTVFLIGVSYLPGSTTAGLPVLFFHDVGDIFLSVTKCFVYTEDHAKVAYSRTVFKAVEITGVAFFIVFLISFAVLRLVCYPTLIYTAVYVGGWHSRDYLPERDGVDVASQAFSDYKFLEDPIPTYNFILTVALLLLLPLHVYWFRCALRVAYFAVLGIYDDERSDDDEYSDDEDNKNKKD